MMKKQATQSILLILVFISWLVLNYNPQYLLKLRFAHWGWIFAAMASVLIIGLMMLRNPTSWKQKLGINFTIKDITGFILLTISLVILSFFIVDYVTKQHGFSFEPQIIHYKKYFGATCPFHIAAANYLYYIFETLNEEMLIGALLLMGLERRFVKLNRNIIAVLIALLFSLMHQALFKWSPIQPGILLTWTTIGSLFFVGLLRNVLILQTRKIAYSWAIHLSFNWIFYAGFILNPVTKVFPSEPEKFNIVFGNSIMFWFTAVLAALSLVWLNFNQLRKNR